MASTELPPNNPTLEAIRDSLALEVPLDTTSVAFDNQQQVLDSATFDRPSITPSQQLEMVMAEAQNQSQMQAPTTSMSLTNILIVVFVLLVLVLLLISGGINNQMIQTMAETPLLSAACVTLALLGLFMALFGRLGTGVVFIAGAALMFFMLRHMFQ